MSLTNEESPFELDRFELVLLKRPTSSPPFEAPQGK
jgi:hypothetical protein